LSSNGSKTPSDTTGAAAFASYPLTGFRTQSHRLPRSRSRHADNTAGPPVCANISPEEILAVVLGPRFPFLGSGPLVQAASFAYWMVTGMLSLC